MGVKKANGRKKRIWRIVILLAVVCMVISLWDSPVESREALETGEPCKVYYLLNIDGMKGLGHTAFMLTDEQGNGQVYSYNGMQYSLMECLMGKAGVGKMKVFTLSPAEVQAFLDTGDLQVEDTAECDNFDRMLYRYISREEYDAIQEGAAKYIDTGTLFETLYASAVEASGEEKAQAEEKINAFLNEKGTLKYQIYTHNCDSVARELIALVDDEMCSYHAGSSKLTPTGNYLGMCKAFTGRWGCRVMGNDTLLERIFWR